MIYEAILHTANRTGVDKEFGQAIDGIKAVIGDAIGGKGYFIISPLPVDEAKFNEALYTSEGYENLEDYREDCENGEIFSLGYIQVGADEVEITKQFKGSL